jgi:hypothetical protein
MNPTRITGTLIVFIALLLLPSSAVRVHASGYLGIYGIVEKVVFEPNEQSPERLQVWGAFAYANGTRGKSLTASGVKVGYLYFKMAGNEDPKNTLTEWADLKSVAGTKQAVGFGSWMYFGGFGELHPGGGATILERSTTMSGTSDLRVRPASETPSKPSVYQTNSGIVKLSETGSHAEIVKQLKAALR